MPAYAQSETEPYIFYVDEGLSLYMQNETTTSLRLGIIPDYWFYEPTISPDGQWMLSANRISRLNGRHQTAFIGNFDAVAWSPDSSQIAFLVSSENLLRIFDVEGKLLNEIPVELAGRTIIDMDFGSKYIAIGTDFGIIGINASSGEASILWDAGRVGYVDWSPDGESLIFVRLSDTAVSGWLADYDNRLVNILHLNADTNDLHTAFQSGTGGFRNMGPGDARWSSDGESFAFITYGIRDELGRSLVIMDAASYEIQHVVTADSLASLTDPYLENFAWSPDSHKLALSASDYTNRVGAILILDTETLELHPFVTTNRYQRNVLWRNVSVETVNALLEQHCYAVTASGANLRREPFNNAPVDASLASQASIEIDAQVESEAYLWYHTIDNLWVRSDIVTLDGDCDGLATVFENFLEYND